MHHPILKRHILFTLALIGATATYAQQWEPLIKGTNRDVRYLYVDTIDNLLYASGTFTKIGGLRSLGIARWNDTTWQEMTINLPGNYTNPHTTIVRYKDEIYVGGITDIPDSQGHLIPNIAKWDGQDWDTVGKGINGPVYSLRVFDDTLYAAGWFSMADSTAKVKGLAKWDGTQWSDVHGLANESNIHSLYDVQMYNGELYIGGNFNDGMDKKEIYRWTGEEWTGVGGGFQGGLAEVSCMEVYDGKLYVAGHFEARQGNPGNFIASWDGEQWDDVGGGTGQVLFQNVVYGNGRIWEMNVFDGYLWCAGQFRIAGGVWADKLARWDGTEWCGSADTIGGNLRRAVTYNGNLIVGGAFDTIGGALIDDIAQWTGSTWGDHCGTYTIGMDKIATDQEPPISVFPNPASDMVTVQSKNAVIEALTVFDAFGKRVEYMEPKNRAVELNTQAWATGIYLVVSQFGNGYSSIKLIRQ